MTRSPTRGESSLGARVTVQDGRLRSSSASTRNRAVIRRRDRRTGVTGVRDFRGSRNERNHMVVSFGGLREGEGPRGAPTGGRGGGGPGGGVPRGRGPARPR